MDEVVGGGHARDHLPAEPRRAQHDPRAGDRDAQVVDRDLLLGRRAGAAEEGDLVLAQHRPRQDVADPPLRQVDDLGEDGLRVERLLGPQVGLDLAVELGVGVAEAAEQPRSRGAAGVVEEDLEIPPVERLLRGRGEGDHDVKGLREGGFLLRRVVGRRHAVEILGGDLDLPLPLGERPVEPGEQEGLDAPPGDAVLLGGGTERDPAQQRRGLGPEVGGALVADADLLVERLEERHLAPLEPFVEVLAEPFEPLDRPVDGETEQDLQGARHLGQHLAAQRRAVAGLDHVELEEARHLDRGGQLAQRLGHRLVAGGIGPRAAGVELLQGRAHLDQPFGGLLGDRGVRDAAELLDQVVDRLRPGDRGGEVGDQDLAVDQLGDELPRLVDRDVAVGIEGDQRLGDLEGGGAPLGAAQGLLEIVVRIHRHQVMGAHLLVQPRLGVAQAAGGAVEAGVGAVGERGAHLRIARQVLAEREQIVHVEPGVPLVGRAGADGDARGRSRRRLDRPQGAAREEAERGGARRHAIEVANQRPLGALPLLAVGLGPPEAQALVERRRGQEHGLQDLGAVGERPQAGAQPLAVGGEGVFQPLGQPLGSRSGSLPAAAGASSPSPKASSSSKGSRGVR